ncbi:MAG: helix-turn-helix domain-containing protein [Actinobacteria bacterium]|nr:helix-turn-helix domain-containing protein [Actinomycetota bacterium]MCG2819494.1 helix-turn-helix domain-containing protein [Actinomycetes bacterium]MBU4218399.1 helix-turn-helix domain-containing protein [Actinomycetota bacterium]MBU4358757.1 helix-turn-helix domain-containing protein [Actinomycetota bacterium]MBU4391019.1 helix-turn-helix domain-containing protein [Actinomycetota bacterium]
MVKALLSPKEVADILSVTPGAVRNWVRNGQLRAYKAGRLIRVRPEDVEAFLDSNRSAQISPGTEKGVKLRDYSSEEIAAFLDEDRIPSDMAERLGKILGL